MKRSNIKLIRNVWLVILLLCALNSIAQDKPAEPVAKIQSAYPDKISSKVEHLDKKLDKKTTRLLEQMQKQEGKMKKKLAKMDSTKAANVFGDTKGRYQQLQSRLDKQAAEVKQYIPSLDTLGSSLKFLQQNSQLISSSKETQEKLANALGKVKGLQTQFQKAEDVKKFIKERKQYLKEQLGQLGFAKELKKMNKQAFYYSQQLKEYKAVLKDRKKIEKKTMEVLTKTTPFKAFMRKHGELAGLFRLPSDPALPGAAGAMTAGLQSRAQVQTVLQNQTGIPGINSQQRIQQGLGAAQGQLNQMKQKLQQLAGGGSDVDIPDFKPNTQKGKSFFKRLEVSANVQSAKHNNLFPVTSDIGVSVGFKPSDKIITGIGGSYKVGWGSGFNHIKITHQGVGLRSFIDIKAKGQFFISGGYEQNYYALIRNIEELRNQDAWKSSALLGLSKKYKIGKKKKGEMKLLYDFLHARSAPRTQPLLFRVGFGF